VILIENQFISLMGLFHFLALFSVYKIRSYVRGDVFTFDKFEYLVLRCVALFCNHLNVCTLLPLRWKSMNVTNEGF
jgi:hypothetical protein